MKDGLRQRPIDRRAVLYGSSATAAATLLGSCSGGGGNEQKGKGSDGASGPEGKGSFTEPLPTPKKFSEAPQLAKMVEAGDLPPVEKRLPGAPYVVPHKWVVRGKYGGTIRTMARDSTTDEGITWFYGSSPLRFLNDGLDVIGGWVERWEQNTDASEWKFMLRQGLRWSDGDPFTVDDIMFWWEDMALNSDHSEVPPDACRSGKGTLATFEKVDDHTLRMSFDSPSPLTAERMAMWPNGTLGPTWIAPKHYVKQFHPKYNEEVGKDWAVPDGLFAEKLNLHTNPDCPTMNAWKVKTYREGRQVVWERNPYYYVVSPDGDQLPYVDSIVWKVNPETKVGKVDVFQGKVDFQMGQHYDIGLPDIERIDANAEDHGIERILIDSGSGTGSLLMPNLDHRDPKYRELFNKPEFRQALSHAVDRKRIQKSVYYKTGYPSTGTLSPKAMEYNINDRGEKIFERWRDSYVEYDLDEAARLLDKAGLPQGPNGTRAFTDGTEFRLMINFPANTGSEHQQKNNIVKEALEELGVRVHLDPINPDAFGEQWTTARLDVHGAWDVGDGPNHLLYPQFMLPTTRQCFAPLQGRWYELRGTDEADRGINEDNPWKSNPPRRPPEEDSPISALYGLYEQTKTEPDEMKRVKLVWDMIKIHIEHGPFFIGTVANTPRIMVKKKALKNVPGRDNLAQGGMTIAWIHPTPGVYDPEIFFWEDPNKH